MALSDWMSLVACAGMLSLAFLVMLRGARSPLSLPLCLLCLDMFIWNFATLARGVSGNAIWGVLDGTFSPFTPPLALHVALVFVGRLRRLKPILVLSYLAFGVLSLWTVANSLGLWKESTVWSYLFLGLWLPLVALELVLLVRHLRQAATLDEQMRTRLLSASVIVGALLGSTEFWDHLAAIPAMGHLGCMSSMALVAAAVLRFRLFGHETSFRVAVYALTLAALGVFGYLLVFRLVRANTAMLVLGSAAVTLALVVAARDVIVSLTTRRERSRQLMSLGRFSAQMAHDLKNPLTALKGGLQFLVEEQARGQSLAHQSEFLEMMVGQVGRIEGVMDRYQRMSRVEPERTPVQINDVIRGVLALSCFIDRADRLEIRTSLADGLPTCQLDRDLVAGALENLMRNALEAMKDGTLTVTSQADDEIGAVSGVVVVVEDTGEGMDARQAERAFDDYYTTKASGSGLGLAFVRRVVEVHGGDVRLSSVLDKGTTVRLRLPRAGGATG